MVQMSLKWFVVTLFLFGGVYFVVPEVHGASYDYYVKEGESGGGSEYDPFGSINDAIDAIGSDKGKKVFVEKGSYSASLTVPEGTVLVGADQKEVTVTGILTLEDEVELEKIGFSGGGGILVKKNAQVTLEKLRFKSLTGLGVGIKTEPGSAKVTIRDSLIDAAKKGMYIQAGSTLQAENVEIINNAEEGIDIRENVSGSITKSVFRDNKESGVEIILGNSEFSFRNNTFSHNGASGIATQYFQGAKKVGNVRIEGNSFSKNDNYGVDCKAPQEGPDSKFYYLNSLTIVSNTFKESNEGDIAKRCKIMTDEERIAFEKEEVEKKAAAEERAQGLSLTEAALADRLAKSIEFRKANQEKYAEAERLRLEPTFQALDTFEKGGNVQLESLMESRSSWRCYIGGARNSDRQLTQGTEELHALLARLEKEQSALRYESNQALTKDKIAKLITLKEAFEKSRKSPACKFSLFGWMIGFFDTKTGSSIFEPIPTTVTLLDQNANARALFLGTLSYYPKVREVAVRFGDERLIVGLIETGSTYSELLGDLRLPLGDEADPLPPLGAVAELAFPVRFSNIFAGANLGAIHLSNAAQIQADGAPFRSTAANLSYADIKTLGQVTGGEVTLTTWLGEKKLHWIDYRENGGIGLDVLRETLVPMKEKNEPVVVVIAWDEKQGKVMSPKREELLQEIVKTGVSLVIGTGLVIPYEQKNLENVPVYTSLGSAFEKFQTGDSSKKSVALEMSIDADGKLRVTEKNLTFTAEKGLEILP